MKTVSKAYSDKTRQIRLIWWLIVPGFIMVGSFAGMTRLDHFTRQGVSYLGYYYAAFAAYLAALCMVVFWRRRGLNTRHTLIVIGVLAVLMRIPLWFTEPTLSNDVWRYLWDGRVMTHGVNPYANRVDSPTLDYLETPLRARVEHSWMASPYPPAAAVVFTGVYAIAAESHTAMQIAFTIFDLATAVVIVIGLRHLGLPVERVLLYAWNPLIVVEFAHSAHVESLMTLWALIALVWLVRDKRLGSMVALVLGILTKFIPVLALPVCLRRWGIKRTTVAGLLLIAAFLPFIRAGIGIEADANGSGLFGAILIYTEQWQTNGGLFVWLVHLLDGRVNNPDVVIKMMGLGLLSITSLYIMWQEGRDQDDRKLFVGAALILSVYLLFSSAMFPWYLTWMIALLPLVLPPGPDMPTGLFIGGWLYFSASVNLSYLFYLDPGDPHEMEWIRQAEYWPLFILLGCALLVAITQRILQRRGDERGGTHNPEIVR